MFIEKTFNGNTKKKKKKNLKPRNLFIVYSSVTDSQINRNSMLKIYLLLKINTTTKFLLFRMKCINDDVY